MRANLQGANFWDADLQKASLWEANLQEADLLSANLQDADLYKANFKEANLSYVDLRGSESLNVEQLCESISLYGAKLDRDIEDQVRIKCSEKLEKLVKPKKIQKEESQKARKLNDDDAFLQDILMPNYVQAAAAVQLLIEKGVFKKEELFDKLKQLQTEHLSKSVD